ncbi:TetR/AcrR family transcriptional regulator [Nocardia terpenica]|uniref:TetR family transcriptional regulator n=1 Tax=Nocardia terpenica TaxID=455432 RepID=A0A164L3T9_9NOCA|nr:TetR/AcrR family transcriptional regulator [Nocardia terpenica]KZM71992.1 TetR family transcriptional regulator [Nocardia terpenica]NQE86420.1 TetR/AcrR family transcriptional regulator [Nocardia terpenica]
MTTANSRSASTRGRIDKQRAVMTAALTVFARVGYAQARVDDIAAEAKVAKATVYSHFGDKETLFRQAVQALSDTALAANLAAIEQLTDGDELPARLREVGLQLAQCYCAEEARALRQLVCAQAARFPDLVDIVTGVQHRAGRALADRLARLSLSGRLRIQDPELAAAHFTALLIGPLDTQSRLGTRVVPDTELRALTDSAVDTFLRAFGQ